VIAERGRRFRKKEVLKMATSDGNYKSQYPKFDFDTEDSRSIACTIIVDNSGSMSGRNIQIARQFSIILSEVFTKSNIPFSVEGFTTKFGGRSGHSNWDSGRRTSVYNMTYKSFDKSEPHSIGIMDGCYIDLGGNADGGSLEYALLDLMERGEDRKIAFYITDGEPVGYCNRESGYEHIRHIRETLEGMEMDFYTIGLHNRLFNNRDQEYLDRIYGQGKYVNIDNHGSTNEALIELFTTVIDRI